MGYKLYHGFQDERRNRTLIHIEISNAILRLRNETKEFLRLELKLKQITCAAN